MAKQRTVMRDELFLTARIALFFVVGAYLGYSLPGPPISLFWPSSGIALAAFLLRGARAIPGVFLGSAATVFVMLPEYPLYTVAKTALCVAVAQTLGYLLAARLLFRFVSSAPIWASARDLFLGSVCVGLGCILSTSLGIGSLYGLELLTVANPRYDLFSIENPWHAFGMWWLGEFCGMLIITPLAFMVGNRIAGRVVHLTRPGKIPSPTHVYSAFTLLGLIGFVTIWTLEGNEIRQQLQREATIAAESLTMALRTAGRDLESIGALIIAGNHLSESEFLRYTGTVFGRRQGYPGAQAVGWAPRIINPRDWELKMIFRGKPTKRLFEVDSKQNPVALNKRADYFPVEYIYPLDDVNRLAIGFDLGSEPMRRAAIDRARDTGNLSMIAPINLVQSSDGGPAMIICWPIYREGASLNSVRMRREALTGVASGVYPIKTLFNVALSHLETNIALHLLDKPLEEGGRIYYTRPSPYQTDNDAEWRAERLPSVIRGFSGLASLNFAGQGWLVAATPGPNFVPDKRSWVPWAILGLILTIGFGISSIMIERISAQRRIAEEQRKTEEALYEARAANEAKSYFMAAASHDIKQPLYALGILADTLLMSNPPENTRPIIKGLRKSIKEMSQHFDTLMDVGRFQDGSFEVRPTTFALAELARRIALEIGPLCREKGLRWSLEFDPVEVHSDPELLLRLIRNLLTNAVRYTEQGGVACSARRHGNLVEFRITDTGPGLSPDQQELVFSEVIRLGPDLIHTTGMGLGLSIVNRISSALELGLQVSSQQGVGTTFTFRLPVQTV